ncbi:D-alanyl-D-alanine carboxypeptidase [Roseivirga pacifica]|uniref:D-alanyl-D-alanine carboxypeptidase n=1 Tax=Roseivirga pacifica TaxID=1267423 RepID=UPI00227D5253|nr:D-alanyl-D-alanine carboxypeptidase [Roseivirga pacifica]
MSKLPIVLLLIIGFSAQAQRYPKRKIRKDLQELPGFGESYIGFKLYDPQKDKVIAENLSEKFMTPASNTKLFTFYGSQKWLPDTLPAMEYVQRGDSLIFWSTGYPLTLHPDHPDSSVINFLSEVEPDKQLYYWPRPTEDGRFGPGWGWDDYDGYYGAEKATFPIYGNSIQFIVDSQNRSFSMTPNHLGFKVKVSDATDTRVRISRDEFWNEYELKFKEIGPNTEQVIDTLIRPFRYSDILFTELLSKASGKKITKITDFSRPERFETVLGVQADTLYKWMLQPSDNLYAEQLLMMISGTQTDTLSTEAGIFLAETPQAFTNVPIFPNGLTWRDGSGLSRYNMFKPNEIVTVLSELYKGYGESLFELLPQGGVSGTIKSWYKGENGPYVFAKTGTLSNNYTLSGFIKCDSGKVLIFTFMANHYTVPTNQVKENFAFILERIRKAY